MNGKAGGVQNIIQSAYRSLADLQTARLRHIRYLERIDPACGAGFGLDELDASRRGRDKRHRASVQIEDDIAIQRLVSGGRFFLNQIIGSVVVGKVRKNIRRQDALIVRHQIRVAGHRLRALLGAVGAHDLSVQLEVDAGERGVSRAADLLELQARASVADDDGRDLGSGHGPVDDDVGRRHIRVGCLFDYDMGRIARGRHRQVIAASGPFAQADQKAIQNRGVAGRRILFLQRIDVIRPRGKVSHDDQSVCRRGIVAAAVVLIIGSLEGELSSRKSVIVPVSLDDLDAGPGVRDAVRARVARDALGNELIARRIGIIRLSLPDLNAADMQGFAFAHGSNGERIQVGHEAVAADHGRTAGEFDLEYSEGGKRIIVFILLRIRRQLIKEEDHSVGLVAHQLTDLAVHQRQIVLILALIIDADIDVVMRSHELGVRPDLLDAQAPAAAVVDFCLGVACLEDPAYVVLAIYRFIGGGSALKDALIIDQTVALVRIIAQIVAQREVTDPLLDLELRLRKQAPDLYAVTGQDFVHGTPGAGLELGGLPLIGREVVARVVRRESTVEVLLAIERDPCVIPADAVIAGRILDIVIVLRVRSELLAEVQTEAEGRGVVKRRIRIGALQNAFLAVQDLLNIQRTQSVRIHMVHVGNELPLGNGLGVDRKIFSSVGRIRIVVRINGKRPRQYDLVRFYLIVNIRVDVALPDIVLDVFTREFDDRMLLRHEEEDVIVLIDMSVQLV